MKRRSVQSSAGGAQESGARPDASEEAVPPNSLISALSKIAALAKPERLVAWDQFARRGLNFVRGRHPGKAFSGCAQYLADFECAWDGEHGPRIQNLLSRSAEKKPIEGDIRFQRRVLDLYLMELGRPKDGSAKASKAAATQNQ